MMKAQLVASDITALLRARNPLLWVVTKEEERAERFIYEAAAAAGYQCRFWDVARGITTFDNLDVAPATDPSNVLALIDQQARAQQGERFVWVLRDLPPWLAPPLGLTVARQLRNLARSLQTVASANAQAIIMLTPSGELPPELQNHATVVDWPLPDREEIAAICDAAIGGLPEAMQANAAPNGKRDAAIDAAIGLSGEEASACYARSLVQKKCIDPAIVASEKKRLIAKERVLEWLEVNPDGLAAVGGNENVKAWLGVRKLAYTRAAREYGLPAPRGVFLVGVAGNGKTLLAKCLGGEWAVPVLKMDLGALKSKYVGESEATLRRTLNVVKAIGRCILLIDEVDKGLQGATSGSSDGGVSTDQLGTLLQFMQDRTCEAFIIATANSVEGLPSAFLRKGRFDELFFVDVPTPEERVAVLKAALREYGRSKVDIDHEAVAKQCEGFTGSEIAAIVPDAMFSAFSDAARELCTADLLNAAATVVPLTKTAAEEIERLRKWASTRARPASKGAFSLRRDAPASEAKPKGRKVDFGSINEWSGE